MIPKTAIEYFVSVYKKDIPECWNAKKISINPLAGEVKAFVCKKTIGKQKSKQCFSPTGSKKHSCDNAFSLCPEYHETLEYRCSIRDLTEKEFWHLQKKIGLKTHGFVFNSINDIPLDSFEEREEHHEALRGYLQIALAPTYCIC